MLIEEDVTRRDSIREAIDIEDEDKITDFKVGAKTCRTIDMDPMRF